jgi:integrase
MSTSGRQRQWQLHWHEILSDYPDPNGGDSVTPERLPELDADFRLQFNLWQLLREARQRAFAILPCGDEMLKRRAKSVGLKGVTNHSFRAAGITTFPHSGRALDDARRLANHASVNTTKLYDHRTQAVSSQDVERIRYRRVP